MITITTYPTNRSLPPGYGLVILDWIVVPGCIKLLPDWFSVRVSVCSLEVHEPCLVVYHPAITGPYVVNPVSWIEPVVWCNRGSNVGDVGCPVSLLRVVKQLELVRMRVPVKLQSRDLHIFHRRTFIKIVTQYAFLFLSCPGLLGRYIYFSIFPPPHQKKKILKLGGKNIMKGKWKEKKGKKKRKK